MTIERDSRQTRRVVGWMLLALSLVWGVFGSVWFLLGLAFLLGGSAGDNPPSHRYLLTHQLGLLLVTGIGAFWPIGGLTFAIYLLVSGRWRPSMWRDSLAIVGALAIVLAIFGVLILQWWSHSPA